MKIVIKTYSGAMSEVEGLDLSKPIEIEKITSFDSHWFRITDAAGDCVETKYGPIFIHP